MKKNVKKIGGVSSNFTTYQSYSRFNRKRIKSTNIISIKNEVVKHLKKHYLEIIVYGIIAVLIAAVIWIIPELLLKIKFVNDFLGYITGM